MGTKINHIRQQIPSDGIMLVLWLEKCSVFACKNRTKSVYNIDCLAPDRTCESEYFAPRTGLFRWSPASWSPLEISVQSRMIFPPLSMGVCGRKVSMARPPSPYDGITPQTRQSAQPKRSAWYLLHHYHEISLH